MLFCMFIEELAKKFSNIQMDKLITTVPEELSGHRLDLVLASLYPQHSRSRLQAWINAGRVKVNNRTLRQKDPVKTGEQIEIQPLFDPQTECQAEDIPLDIVYEDEQILLINKPAGLIVHPGAGNPAHTLQNALLFHNPGLAKIPRAGIVQRLDKDTSGIMIIANTPEIHTYLVDQLQRRLIRREYQAIVTGLMTAGGKIEAPIGRHPVFRKRMTVTSNGKPAVTHYRIIKKYRHHTHILVRLETGRTHQIRVHMAHIHYPVTGDPVYGGRNRLPGKISPDLRETIQSFPRQALHASALTVVHPGTKAELTWETPLPADIQSLIDAIAKNEDYGS